MLELEQIRQLEQQKFYQKEQNQDKNVIVDVEVKADLLNGAIKISLVTAGYKVTICF